MFWVRSVKKLPLCLQESDNGKNVVRDHKNYPEDKAMTKWLYKKCPDYETAENMAPCWETSARFHHRPTHKIFI